MRLGLRLPGALCLRTLPARQRPGSKVLCPLANRFNHTKRTAVLSMSDLFSKAERPNKRRRIVNSAVPDSAMAQGTGGQTPRVHLSSEEALLRRLLLDTVEHICLRQKNKVNGPDLVLRFTGGWVRDKLLGVDSQDIDVGISTMTGYDFGLALKEYLDIPEKLEKYKAHYPVHALKGIIGGLHKIAANPKKSKHLETTTIRVFGFDVDLVNLRKETYTDDSRNPQVEFGTAEEDALRRDATVNALFYNLHTDEVEDFTGRGLSDMESKLIRTPLAPYQTFKDDPLRVLRLIRFASRLGYTIDPDTETSMYNDDIKHSLKLKISQERIGIEIEKMLRGPDPLGSLEIINRLGLYDTIFSDHQSEATVDTSPWPVVYTLLNSILNDELNSGISHELRKSVKGFLVRDKDEKYRSWMIAALSPWAMVDVKNPLTEDEVKKMAPHPARVARDSLRCEKKLTTLLSVAITHYGLISDVKTAFVNGELNTCLADTRWKLAKLIRTLGADWRLCFIQAMLLDVMQGKAAELVLKDYLKMLQFLEEQNLLDVYNLRPLVNGRDMIAALNAKPGAWLTSALEITVEWQIRNPDRSDAEGAIDEAIRRREEFKQ
ncbi:CCA tRNA nucleotidyltransferase, mitochondrial [Microsporum canis]|uniref:tRNA nucleotidyltransferase n=1 Tax=Arthroderma otae (strain ATCC MYA-4605 / CBS 113480) TaxID=554155 RepID=C5FME7_ARTOC|nr:tRNA nucleotidyltransferase [Microsporum canis CBS 113480]EEQ31050.1 tRNA nucleotidyltransferase [Microsporum canis CBS 113480]